MGIRLLLLGQIISIIATESTNTSWVIEGERIELPASPDADSLSSASIKSVNWFDGTKVDTKKMIVALEHPNQGRLSIDFTEQTYGDLIIEPVNRADAGYYTCQVVEEDEATMWKNTLFLDVYYMDPPTVEKETERNSNTTFSCKWSKIKPAYKPIVKWFLDGRELSATKNNSIIKEGKLLIPNITESNFGNYTCSITVRTNRGNMTKMSKNSRGLPVKTNVQSADVPAKKDHMILRLTVSMVVITVCVISFVVFYLDRKYASSQKHKSPFELFAQEEFFCSEGESADMVLRYEPKNAKTASISWFKIDKEQDRTDHILTFNTDFKQRQKAPGRKRLPSLRPMNMQVGVDTNIYSGMSLNSEPVNNKPGPSYFVLDGNCYDIKKNAIKCTEGVSDQCGYDYIAQNDAINCSGDIIDRRGYDYIAHNDEDSLKKSKEIDSRDRYAVSLEEVGSFRLTINNLIPSDAGVYKCTVVMKNDETHLKTMTLFVKPKLVAHVRDVKVEEGSSVATIICELFPKDSDIKTTTWYKRDRSYTIAIASSNDAYIKANPKYEALIDEEKGRALLSIKNINVEDRGKYVCVAQRTGDTDESSSATGEGTLSVACNLTVRVYNQKAFIGDESTFLECRILPPGEDIIGVMWYRYNEHGKFNGNVLASTNDIARPNSKYTTCIEEGGSCILYIHSVVKGDAGKYVCKVKRTFQERFFKGSAVLTVETK